MKNMSHPRWHTTYKPKHSPARHELCSLTGFGNGLQAVLKKVKYIKHPNPVTLDKISPLKTKKTKNHHTFTQTIHA